jgi:adenine-specific DNA-methyltransferase
MNRKIEELEQERIALQTRLDAGKTSAERNRLGQFATPTALARAILSRALDLLPATEKVRFLDPAMGTGAFYSALRAVAPQTRIAEALGFEVDPHYGRPSAAFWQNEPVALRLEDFTTAEVSPCFNTIICNPPYVRHHHLESGRKRRLQRLTQRASGMRLSGLAGLYCHFLGLSHAWMTDGGIAGWLIPSEFMDVNYGHAVKRYLLDRVTLLRIHRCDPSDVQFGDALVSSAIVWFRNTRPPAGHAVTFTLGGSLTTPRLTRTVPAAALAAEPKWTRFPTADTRSHCSAPTLSDFFQVRRGVATGDNGYFILSEQAIASRGLPRETFTPILPSPRYLPDDEVRARADGTPDIERRLFLLDTRLRKLQIARRYPKLSAYLEEGMARGLHERYLCKHRRLWYSQEHRPPAPIVCTYLGRRDTRRGRPFRFILNGSRATVANVYLAMYPTPLLAPLLARDATLLRRIWMALNNLPAEHLLGQGRVYGGGLHKLEPQELANVPVPDIADLGAVARVSPFR